MQTVIYRDCQKSSYRDKQRKELSHSNWAGTFVEYLQLTLTCLKSRHNALLCMHVYQIELHVCTISSSLKYVGKRRTPVRDVRDDLLKSAV
jgi:hypothetical protein